MPKLVDLTGCKFGRLTILRRDPARTGPKIHWIARCECGTVKSVNGGDVKQGRTQSCGCYMRERIRETHTTHGAAPFDKTKRDYLYRLWQAIKTRCTNPRQPSYQYYGARGVRVHAAWMHDFAAFRDYIVSVLGERPPGRLADRAAWSIDRIDTNGDYEPGNLRWADMPTQMRNRRKYTHRKAA